MDKTAKFKAVLVQAAQKAKKDAANAVACPLPSLILWLVSSYSGEAQDAVIKCYLALQAETKPNQGKGGCPQNTIRTGFGDNPLIYTLVNFGKTKEVSEAVEKELARVDVTVKGLVQKEGEKWPNGAAVITAGKVARRRIAAGKATDAKAETVKEILKKIKAIEVIDLAGVDTVGLLTEKFEEMITPLRTVVSESDIFILALEKAAADREIKISFGGGFQKGPKGKTYSAPSASVNTEA